MATIIVNPYYVSGGVSSTLLTGLVSWWDLTEASGTRSDSHGPNDLAEYGTVSVATGPNGSGNALSLSGSGCLYISSASQVGLSLTADFTIAGWLKTPASSGAQTVAGKYNTTGDNREYEIGLNNTQGRIVVSNNGATATFSNPVTLSNDGNWHLVLFQYEDGVEVGGSEDNGTLGTSARTQDVTAKTAAFCIGGRDANGTPGTFATSLTVGPFAVWSRLLTTDEKTELYNSGTALYYADL